MTYTIDNINGATLALNLRLLWQRYQQQEIEDDELIEKLEKILHWSGVVQE